jgi:hypothetical protein
MASKVIVTERKVLPAKLYKCEYVGTELATSKKDGREFRKWYFTVLEPKEYVGEKIQAISSALFNVKSKGYGWYVAISGTEPGAGEEVDLDDPVGSAVLVKVIVVELDGQKFNRVEDVMALQNF